VPTHSLVRYLGLLEKSVNYRLIHPNFDRSSRRACVRRSLSDSLNLGAAAIAAQHLAEQRHLRAGFAVNASIDE
jgi:hypothetical protein